jgi:predicted ATP-dependent endonuclease of OLD family
MELLGLELSWFRRFESASIDLLGHPIGIVGPNEAGKSSLLAALLMLNDHAPIPAWDITRRTEPDPSHPILRAWFSLEEADKAAIAHIPEARGIRKYILTKQRDGRLVVRLEPEFGRDRGPRKAALALLQKVKSSKWADGREPLLDEYFQPAEQVLASTGPNLSEAERMSLSALAESLASERPGSNPDRLRGQLLATEEHESKPHPRSEVVKILERRRPEFLLFDPADRELHPVYDLSAPTVPVPLANFAELAGLRLLEAASAVARRDFGALEEYEREANQTLDRVFSSAWRQSALGVQVRIDHNELRIIIRNRSGQFTELGERSDGLRIFVALMAYLGPSPREIPPILLIDEAETHLHYDAQADLIRVLTQQDAAAKVIYTTHSAGCLPLDIGNGTRAVVMLDGDRSAVENSFWLLGAGYTPLIMAMGATTLAFTPSRRAVIGEGACEAILLPTLLREAVPAMEVDYQVAPGLANATQEAISRLDLEAARIAYAVDGDQAGAAIVKRLTAAGIPADRIVVLGGPGSQMTLEDTLDPLVYLRAVNRELDTWRPGTQVPESALSDPSAAAAVKRWCQRERVPPPDKVRVAAQVLDIARSTDRGVTSRPGRLALKKLHLALRAILDRPTHTGPTVAETP